MEGKGFRGLTSFHSILVRSEALRLVQALPRHAHPSLREPQGLRSDRRAAVTGRSRNRFGCFRDGGKEVPLVRERLIDGAVIGISARERGNAALVEVGVDGIYPKGSFGEIGRVSRER